MTLRHPDLSKAAYRQPIIVAALLIALMPPLATFAMDRPTQDGFVAREYLSSASVTLPYRLYSPASAKADERLRGGAAIGQSIRPLYRIRRRRRPRRLDACICPARVA